jgi:hypothetical protein
MNRACNGIGFNDHSLEWLKHSRASQAESAQTIP